MMYAIFNAKGVCVNRILWDGENNWQPPEGHTAVADPGNVYPVYQKPVPVSTETLEQKLERIGLSVNDLRTLLGST